MLFHVVFQAEISLATGFMEETWSRNLLNLMVTPLREVEYAAGVVLFGLAKLAIGVGTVALVALALFAFDITSLGFALIPFVALLLFVGWAVGLVVIGLILRVGQGAEILAWGFIALLLPLSGIFYPVERAPRCAAARRGGPPDHSHLHGRPRRRRGPADSVGPGRIAAAGAVVLARSAVWFLVRMLDVFRRRGYISRHV